MSKYTSKGIKIASKSERFVIFIQKMENLPAAKTSQEALAQISRTLNETENEHTNIPFDPKTYITDGRMYPPQMDSKRAVRDREDIVRYRSAGHNTYIGINGAILIMQINGSIDLQKPGADGDYISL